MPDSVTDSQEFRIREDERKKLWERSVDDKLSHLGEKVDEIYEVMVGDSERPGLANSHTELHNRVERMEQRWSALFKWSAGITGSIIVGLVFWVASKLTSI